MRAWPFNSASFSQITGIAWALDGQFRPSPTLVATPFATITPGTGDSYFLIVPLDQTREGSCRVDAQDDERPPSISGCRPSSDNTNCP